MTLLAHAITAAPPAALSPEGLRGRPLAWSEAAAGLGLWSTDWPPGMKLERPDALEHHRLVERICAAQPCLPVRFGTAFANVDAARASLDKRAETLHAALARVSGKSELALTLLWRDQATVTPAPVTGPGRRYMEERRAELSAGEAKRARAETMVERIVAELAIERPLVWHETCTTANVAVSLAVLVPTERALDRKAELGRIASEFGDVITVLNGPWPPYTFARTE
ncbi:MAG TPA: GvpL/GvpF family gas vesicle protein [Verrucomicrobiae bacterium]|nr:GvpL/GvpF family gas vesicle protein [Verrucomicrobiae bacterium]